MHTTKKIEWVLRIAVAGEFAGHGIFALQAKQGWIPYFTTLGFSSETAITLMPFIGIMDLALAFLVLIFPVRIALLWMTLWGFWTALLRPIAGEPFADFIERWANWGAPLALLLLRGWPQRAKDWFR